MHEILIKRSTTQSDHLSSTQVHSLCQQVKERLCFPVIGRVNGRRGVNEGRGGAEESEPRYALFVIYSWNYEVLLTAVEGYQAAGFGNSLIIIDNSPHRDIVGDERIQGMVGEVIATRARLTFSQSQNYIAGRPFALLLSKAPNLHITGVYFVLSCHNTHGYLRNKRHRGDFLQYEALLLLPEMKVLECKQAFCRNALPCLMRR